MDRGGDDILTDNRKSKNLRLKTSGKLQSPSVNLGICKRCDPRVTTFTFEMTLELLYLKTLNLVGNLISSYLSHHYFLANIAG